MEHMVCAMHVAAAAVWKWMKWPCAAGGPKESNCGGGGEAGDVDCESMRRQYMLFRAVCVRSRVHYILVCIFSVCSLCANIHSRMRALTFECV